MIAKSEIISDFQRFYREGRGYIPGTSGETWTREKQNRMAAESQMVAQYGEQWIGKKVDDCSGAFVDAYRQHGENIYHGSNRIAREYVVEIVPISEAKPGYAAFKIRKPGESGYALPDEYKKGGSHYNGDLNDYYHIGLIDDDGKNVINAQSTSKGFTRTALNLWHCAARLKAVSYGGELNLVDYEEGGDTVEENYKAKVVAAQGNTVNMRKSASSKADVVRKIPIGTIVTVIKEYNDGWDYIGIDGTAGYMMKQFLQRVSDDGAEEDGYVTITLRKDVYEALKESVIDAGGI